MEGNTTHNERRQQQHGESSIPPPDDENVQHLVVENYHHHLNNNGSQHQLKDSIRSLNSQEGQSSSVAESEHSTNSALSSLDDSNSQHFHPLGAVNSNASFASSLVLSGRHSDFTVPTSNHASSYLQHRGSPPLHLPQDDDEQDDDIEHHEHYGDYSDDYRGRRSIFGTCVEQRYHHHNVNTAPQPLLLSSQSDTDFGNGCDGYLIQSTAPLPTTTTTSADANNICIQTKHQPQQLPMPSSPLFYLPSVNPAHEHFVISRIVRTSTSSSSASRSSSNHPHLPVIFSQNEMKEGHVPEESLFACPRPILKTKKKASLLAVAPSRMPLTAASAHLPTKATASTSHTLDDDMTTMGHRTPQHHRRSSPSSSCRRKSSTLSSSSHHRRRSLSLSENQHQYHVKNGVHHHHQKATHVAETTIHAQSLLLGLAFAAVWSPYNMMAPNLTEMAETFHLKSSQERDLYLGSYAALATSVVSFPIGAGIGILTDFCASRKHLFVATVLLGAFSALWTGCSGSQQRGAYTSLLVSRLLSGGFMAGSVPVAFSFLGDLFAVQERNAASSGLTAMMGLGIIAGQVYAGVVGPASPYGWQQAFYVSSAISIVLAILCMLYVQEPERGGKEKVLQDMIKAGTRYDRKLSWSVFYNVVRNNKSTLILLWQGFFSSIPWGVIFTFLNDVLSQEQGLSVPAATYLVFWYGVGCAAGGIAGGYWGQKLQDINRTFLPLFMGITTALGIVPFWWLLTRPLTMAAPNVADDDTAANTATPTTVAAVLLAFLCGFIASLPSVNVRPILINVNPPETRGASLTAANILINLGRGVGPSCVTFFTWISTKYMHKGSLSSLIYHGHYRGNENDDDHDGDDTDTEQVVFGSPRLHAILTALCIFWIISALLLFLLMRTIPMDQDRMEAELATYAEQAMLSMQGKKTANLAETTATATTTASAYIETAFERKDLGEQFQSPMRASYQSVDDDNGGEGILETSTDQTILPDLTTPTRRISTNPILSLLMQSGTFGRTASLLAMLSSPSPSRGASGDNVAVPAEEEVSIEDRMTTFDSVAAQQTLVYIRDGIKELGEEVMLKTKQQLLCQPGRGSHVQESSEEEYSSGADSNDDDDDSKEDDSNIDHDSSSPLRGRTSAQKRHLWLQQQSQQQHAKDPSVLTFHEEGQSPPRRPVHSTNSTTTTPLAAMDDDVKAHPNEKTPFLV
jgi:MFS family permease